VVSVRGVLIIQQQRPEQRHSRAVRFLERGVKKRQQLVTQLQIFPNDVFVILSETPRLLIIAVGDLVIPTERRQKTDLIGTDQQLAVAATDKTADVAAHKRLARQTQRREHRNI